MGPATTKSDQALSKELESKIFINDIDIPYYSFDQKEKETHCKNLFDKCIDGKAALVQLIRAHIATGKEIENGIIQSLKDTPLLLDFKQIIIKDDSRKSAMIQAFTLINLSKNSCFTQYPDIVTKEIADRLKFFSALTSVSIDKAISTYNINTDSVIEFIQEAPMIKERLSFIRRGIKAYFDKDYVITIHILVPQIEYAFRTLLAQIGEKIIKKESNGTESILTLDEILRNQRLESLFKKQLGGDQGKYIMEHFRSLFTNPKGLNIRNEVCHGLLHEDGFDRAIANHLLLSFLFLGVIRLKIE